MQPGGSQLASRLCGCCYTSCFYNWPRFFPTSSISYGYLMSRNGTIDDANPIIRYDSYGAWQLVPDLSAYGTYNATVHSTTMTNARASIQFADEFQPCPPVSPTEINDLWHCLGYFGPFASVYFLLWRPARTLPPLSMVTLLEHAILLP